MSFASGHVAAIVCHVGTFWFIWHWESLPRMQAISPRANAWPLARHVQLCAAASPIVAATPAIARESTNMLKRPTPCRDHSTVAARAEI
jgi:hypothetical protein